MREWLYGRNPVMECLRAGRRDCYQLWIAGGAPPAGSIDTLTALAQERKLSIERPERKAFDRFGREHQGVALEVSGYPYVNLADGLALAESRRDAPFLLLLDTLQDPQNFGTLLRTAEAVGVHGVGLPLKQTVTVTPAVVSSSAGASEHLFIFQANLAGAIEELKKAGVWVIGLDRGSGSRAPEAKHLRGPLVLVVGGEGQGMRRLIRESCDLLIELPMVGRVASLNAATAGSIGLYLAFQARKTV